MKKIKIFKFGGASIKDGEAVKNLCKITQNKHYKDNLLIVISAMGKTTNALEKLFDAYYQNKDYQSHLKKIKEYHLSITKELFPNPGSPIFNILHHLFSTLKTIINDQSKIKNYNEGYDQVISYGELFSSKIISEYLIQQHIHCQWIDSRKYIQTDNSWREAKINWAQTENLIKRDIPKLLNKGVVLTQGFIGGTSPPKSPQRGDFPTPLPKGKSDGKIPPSGGLRGASSSTTTLGREGSDFSAAIYAYCLNADSVTIWKDVPGVLNADPKIMKHTTRYGQLSYNQAIEMAYYGASVIHPKTIKPLENKSIPLYVRSFNEPQKKGTTITYSGRAIKIEKKVSHELQKNILQGTPSIIFKRDQCLMFLSVKDYSFVSEKNLSTIFNALAHLNIKINLMQNSAISFSICVDNDPQKIEKLREALKNEFVFRSNENLQLITIMNFNVKTVKDLTRNREILLEQMTRGTFQVVVK